MKLLRAIVAAGPAFALSCLAALSSADTVRVTLDCPDQVLQAWAVERRVTPTGITMHKTPARVDGQMISIEGLERGRRYDLLIQTRAGLIEGWDASVPASDYDPEQPLDDAARGMILAKIEKMERRAFYDDVFVLDIAGNIQHAAVLLFKFHHRGFVEAEDRGPDLVWRVDRMQYENPDEQSWVPHTKLALYALQRHRVTRSQYDQLRVLLDRRLGGIAWAGDSSTVDLGTITLPAPPPGVHACDEKGTIIKPTRLKPDPQVSVIPSPGARQ